MTLFCAFTIPTSELLILSLATVTAGLCLFVLGFRSLARKHLIVDTPTSRIASASMGLVEVNGHANGTYTVPAPITGTACLLYRTVAWQQGDSRRSNEWDKIAEERQYVPFLLDDGTGHLLVDPSGAELDLECEYRGEFDASPLSFTGIPDSVPSFLNRNGASISRRIRIEEWTIKPDQSLFIVGTLAENTGAHHPSETDGADEEKFVSAPEIIRLSPEPVATGAADMTLQGKIAAALTRAGIQKPEAWAAAGVSIGTAAHPAQQITHIGLNRQTGPEASGSSGKLDLAPPVVLRKGENNPMFLISWQSRQDVIRSLTWKSVTMIFGGSGLMLAGIYVLLWQAGML